MKEVEALAKPWKELKQELEEETEKIFLICPDEIKRFYYGIITHSDAGKHALNQYFGHWVHLYAWYFSFSSDILGSFSQLAKDSNFELKHLKALFCQFAPAGPMIAYGGQKSLGKYADAMVRALDTLQTKEEFLELLDVFQIYVGRLYWWVHWYFPWGIGPTLCPRLSAEDISEIVRLSQST